MLAIPGKIRVLPSLIRLLNAERTVGTRQWRRFRNDNPKAWNSRRTKPEAKQPQLQLVVVGIEMVVAARRGKPGADRACSA